MAWSTFWIITAVCAGSIFAFRTVPLLLLANRELPQGLARALDFVPVCAFAALVTNDLFNPATFAAGLWPAWWPWRSRPRAWPCASWWEWGSTPC